MARYLSTAEIETQIFELSNALSGGEWNDGIKDSYFRFLNEEKTLLSNIKWLADKANAAYGHVNGVSVEKFKSTYSECVSKFQRLQRGG